MHHLSQTEFLSVAQLHSPMPASQPESKWERLTWHGPNWTNWDVIGPEEIVIIVPISDRHHWALMNLSLLHNMMDWSSCDGETFAPVRLSSQLNVLNYVIYYCWPLRWYSGKELFAEGSDQSSDPMESKAQSSLNGREPGLRTGDLRRLVFNRSWVWIPALDNSSHFLS